MGVPGLAAVGIGATLAGGFAKAAGDLFGGAAQGKMYEYQAGLATQRAQIAEQNANFAVVSGESRALQSGLQTGQVVGRERVGQAAGNIDPGTGSAARVRASQTWAGQVGEANIRTDAARQAYGQQIQAAAETSQAQALSTASATARTASYLGAGADVVGAVGASVAPKWIQAQTAGIGGDTSNQPLGG